MMHYLLWPAALLLGWVLCYAIWIRPLRAKIAAVVPSIVEAPPEAHFVAGGIAMVPPTAWQKFVAMVEGWKTIGLSFALSIFASASSIFDVFAQNSSMIDDLQGIPWASFLRPDVALKIVSALLVIIPIFHLWGKVKAAMAVPVRTVPARADGP